MSLNKEMKKITLAASVLLTAGLLAAPSAFATMLEECGVGGVLIGENSPMLASSTNLTTTLGIFATTTGVVAPGTCVDGPRKYAGLYINENFDHLVSDIASGQGEYLAALDEIMNCSYASENLRNDYATYTNSNYYLEASDQDNKSQLFDMVYSRMSSEACGS